MSDATTHTKSGSESDWIRQTLDKAVRDISDLGVIPDELVEARPVWTVNGEVMIGQARKANDPSLVFWFISGNLPTDYISLTAASTARDALRHFSMKWQLDAERYADPATRKAHGLDESKDWSLLTKKLITKAEQLYAMAETDRLWRGDNDA